MACYSCYAFDEKDIHLAPAHAAVFRKFKEDIHPEVTVFKMRLLPISVLILYRLRLVFEAWLEKSFEHFQRKCLEVASVVLEHKRLVKCLELWFTNLERDVEKWKDHAEPVLEDLYLDSRRIRTEEHILRVCSKVDTGEENMFIPLLFVPGVSERAAPYVHGGQIHHFKMPPICHNIEERVVAGTLSMTETLFPCLDQFRELMKNIGISLEKLISTLEELHAMGDYMEEVVEEAVEAEKNQNNYREVIDPRRGKHRLRSLEHLPATGEYCLRACLSTPTGTQW